MVQIPPLLFYIDNVFVPLLKHVKYFQIPVILLMIYPIYRQAVGEDSDKNNPLLQFWLQDLESSALILTVNNLITSTRSCLCFHNKVEIYFPNASTYVKQFRKLISTKIAFGFQT